MLKTKKSFIETSNFASCKQENNTDTPPKKRNIMFDIFLFFFNLIMLDILPKRKPDSVDRVSSKN